jgi:hypothetical protein
MRLDENPVIFAENVAIVQSQDSTSLVPLTISITDFLNFAGDTRKTIQVHGLSSEAVNESLWLHIRNLYGAWIESGDEDKQIEELYQSRLIPSSMPDEDE